MESQLILPNIYDIHCWNFPFKYRGSWSDFGHALSSWHLFSCRVGWKSLFGPADPGETGEKSRKRIGINKTESHVSHQRYDLPKYIWVKQERNISNSSNFIRPKHDQVVHLLGMMQLLFPCIMPRSIKKVCSPAHALAFPQIKEGRRIFFHWEERWFVPREKFWYWFT